MRLLVIVVLTAAVLFAQLVLYAIVVAGLQRGYRATRQAYRRLAWLFQELDQTEWL
jgi:hypothetical protein